MDYRTLFIFDVVSLSVYALAIIVLAGCNRKMVGLRWFAASVLLQLSQTTLQAFRGYIPPGFTVLLPTVLQGLGFFAMYLGFHWMILHKPLRTRIGPLLIYLTLLAYAGLYFFRAPYDFAVGMAPVFICSGLSVGMLLKLGTGPVKAVARVTAGVLLLYMCVLIYRTVIMVGTYGYDAAARDLADGRLLAAMLGLMLLGGCLVLMYLWFFVAETHGRLAKTAREDPLTGVLNRRAMDVEARREMSRSRRTGAPLAMIMLDIDHFKKVNDFFGHGGGDEALRVLVSIVRDELREVDLLARLGGEEFVILLPDTAATKATHLAERLREAAQESATRFHEHMIHLTISAGVTQFLPSDDSWEDMLARADAALYQGKREGRNRVVLDQRAIAIHVPPPNPAKKFSLPPRREKSQKLSGQHRMR